MNATTTPNNSTSNMPLTINNAFKIEDFMIVLLANWYWIVLSVVLCVSAATFHLLRTTPVYTRSTSLLIKNDDSAGGSLQQEFKELGITPSLSNINNEILILSAPVIMEETVRRVHADIEMRVKEDLHYVPLYDKSPVKLLLPEMPETSSCSFKMKLRKDKTAELYDFSTSHGLVEKSQVVAFGTIGRTPVGKVVIQATEFWDKNYFADEIVVTKYPLKSIAGSYSGRLNIALVDKESTVLDITLTDASRQRADDVLYKLIEVYNEQWMKDRNRVAESTYQFITDRLANLSKELGDVDQQISDYKSNTLLPDVDAAASMYMSESAKNNDAIISLHNQITMASYIRKYLADMSHPGKYLPTNVGIGQTGVEQMIAAYNARVNEYNALLKNSSENTPAVQEISADLALQRTTILHSLDNLIAQLNTQVQAWEKTETQTNKKLATAPQQVKQLLSVGRQQKVKEALYIYLLQKREENELSKTFTAWNTRIIQPSGGSNAPSGPNKQKTLLIAFCIGLAIPISILFLRENFDYTVRGRSDIEQLGLPLLGEIPALMQDRPWWKPLKKNVQRLIYVEPNSSDLINESFRILRTKLDYFLGSIGTNSKVVMLTSFNAGSGKSFISANLAMAIGLKNKRVIAIDLDLRHCSLSNILNQPKKGLTHYLGGIEDDVESLIMHDAIHQGVDILPVGIVPPKPTELLLSDRLTTLIEHLRDSYDYVILDCPPIDIVADTIIVKKLVDVSVFVVRAGLMDRRLLKEVQTLYNENTYKNMALLLNGTKYVSSRYGNYRYGYGYGYGHGQGYGYGYGYSKSSRK